MVITPLMLLAGYGFGFGIKNISIFMKIAMNSSYLRHSVLGVMSALYGNNRQDSICPDKEVMCVFQKTQYLLKTIGLENCDYFISIMALIGFYLIFSIAGYLLIKDRLSISQSNFLLFQYFTQFLRRYFNFSSY